MTDKTETIKLRKKTLREKVDQLLFDVSFLKVKLEKLETRVDSLESIISKGEWT